MSFLQGEAPGQSLDGPACLTGDGERSISRQYPDRPGRFRAPRAGANPSRMLEGLHPHAPTHILRFATDEPRARALTELLGEVFDPAETAVAAFEAEDGRTWLLEAYFSQAPDEDAIRELARSVRRRRRIDDGRTFDPARRRRLGARRRSTG